MKPVFLASVLLSAVFGSSFADVNVVGSGAVGHGGNLGVNEIKPTTELYYYTNNNNNNPNLGQYSQQQSQQYQNYVAPTGYQNYPAWNNYYSNQQKQDLFSGLGFGGGNGNSGGGGGGAGDLFNTENFDLSSSSGIIGTVLAALGLKSVTKLGLVVAGIFFFFVVPLIIVPVVLAIVSIVLSAVGLGGGNGDNGDKMSLMDRIKENLGMDQKQRAIMSTFYKFANNEECVEKISCAISQRAYTRNFSLKNMFNRKTKSNTDGNSDATNDSPSMSIDDDSQRSNSQRSKGSFMSRISRAIKADDCQVYKCSMLSYFSS